MFDWRRLFFIGMLIFVGYTCGLLSRRAVPLRARTYTLVDGVLLALRAVNLTVEKSLLDERTGDLLKLSFGNKYVLDDFIEVY